MGQRWPVMTAAPYTTAEAAPLLRASKRQVTIWCASGELRASKPGRSWLIAPEDIEAFLDDKANRPRRKRRQRAA